MSSGNSQMYPRESLFQGKISELSPISFSLEMNFELPGTSSSSFGGEWVGVRS